MEWISQPQAWIGLVTLIILEIVLGIDNIVFISILASRLPEAQRAKARQVGLALALITRILLLLSITWIMGLTQPLFGIWGYEFDGRDLILAAGGLFLIYKSVHEIHNKLEGTEEHHSTAKVATFGAVVGQIMVLDIVFSLDSVITAVGMVEHIEIMIAAVVIAVGVMLVLAGSVSDFIERHPTVKMLALSFLLLIGVNLLADGLGHHIPRGYIYFAMGFSVFVELLNLRMKAKSTPVRLKKTGPSSESLP